MPNKECKGKHAEQQARYYLQRQGLIFIMENYYCRQGEIDLIMQDADQLVFVEVKYRKTSIYGSGAEFVTPQKQRKIIYTARHYLHQHKLTEQYSSRFDIVSIEPASIQWIKSAFDTCGS